MSPGKHAAPTVDGVAEEPTSVRVVQGNPTPEEVAAVTTVLQAAIAEEIDGLTAEDTTAVSAWARSQRSIRQPHSPGAGHWRSFSG